MIDPPKEGVMKSHTRRVAAIALFVALTLEISPSAAARGRDDLSPIDRFLKKIQRLIGGLIDHDFGISPPTP
jgi:hypothetical protein